MKRCITAVGLRLAGIFGCRVLGNREKRCFFFFLCACGTKHAFHADFSLTTCHFYHGASQHINTQHIPHEGDHTRPPNHQARLFEYSSR